MLKVFSQPQSPPFKMGHGFGILQAERIWFPGEPENLGAPSPK